ncbi:HAD family hydrolase [Carnobacterium maltaromaticum]|uniref:HAD family hydrolase n=1 Tax=Carnobacterium maltaromaticum TaxID=2751 RepID=UPI001E47ACF6|nr:HAD family hydrolase [Carnobacterium maltaromaticum]
MLSKRIYLFDFDGTLGDSEECSIVATQGAFKEVNLPIPNKNQIKKAMGIPIEKSFKSMGADGLTANQFESLLDIFRERYKENEVDHLRLFPYVEETLSKLEERSVVMYVLSSKKSDVLQRNLEELGIDAYFKDYYGSDKVEHYKPHPDGIYKIIEKYQHLKSETLMIGDASYDLQMARRAGVSNCGVTWGSFSEADLRIEKPDFIVHDFRDLLDLTE